MFLIVNGERLETAAARVDVLLGELQHDSRYLAVAVNQELVPRARWAETLLENGDSIEIITPRQGG
jgi:sulfur carrier protein